MGDIAFGIAAAFMLGVFAANMGWMPGVRVVAVVFCVAMVGIIFSCLGRGGPHECNKGMFAALIVIVMAISAGALYYHAYVHWTAAHTHLPAGKNAAFFGVVTEEPKSTGKFIMLTVALARPYAGTVDIFASANNDQFRYGDDVWIKGKIKSKIQDDSLATFTKKTEKQDGLIDLNNDSYKNYLKILAYEDWPKAFFEFEKDGLKKKVIIKKVEYKDGILSILRVIPEGKKEMDYKDFLRGNQSTK